jgi:hypothetical protein
MFIFFVTSTASRNACHHKPDERPPSINLLGGNVNLASLDVVGDVLGAAAVNTATNRESGTEDLKDGTLELLSQRTVAHGAGDLDDVIERDRLGVLDVLLLLAVTRGLLEGLDDQGRGGGNNRDRGLTVLDGELDSHTETLPVTSVLGNIFTDLLGRQTKGTDLGGERRLGADLTTSHTQVDDLHLIGIELGSYRKIERLVAIVEMTQVMILTHGECER